MRTSQLFNYAIMFIPNRALHKHILDKGAWYFNKVLVVMKPWSRELSIVDDGFQFYDF